MPSDYEPKSSEGIINNSVDRLFELHSLGRTGERERFKISAAGREDSQPHADFIPVIPFRKRRNYNFYLMCHLQRARYYVLAVTFSIMAKGHDRVGIVVHLGSMDAETDWLAACVREWAQEMVDKKDCKTTERVPVAA